MAKKTEAEMADEQSEEEILSGTDVTTSHYVPKTARDKCQNEACGQSFAHPVNLRRPHHCRRCGEIFCRPCLQYNRRLNAMAQPDPDGILCKVCLSCFEDRVLNLGCTKRSQTELFLLLRKQVKDEMSDIVYEYEIVTRNASEQPRFWKEQFKVDILQECLRLLRGFKSEVGVSDTLKAVHHISSHVNIPSWQKSTFWMLESQITRCRQCDGKLRRIKKIRNCRVCGLTLCKFCSQKDLLLYFEDGQTRTKDDTPHLAIIRYTGCPDKEPEISQLLHCCSDCKEEIVRKQIEDDRWYLQKPKTPDLQSEMVRMDGRFQHLIEDIREQMDKLPTTMNDPIEITDEVYEEDSITSLRQFETKRRMLTMKQLQRETIKDNINQKMRTYWNMYSELKAVLKSNSTKLTQKQFEFVMNYFIAKKDFYAEIKAELGKISRVNET